MARCDAIRQRREKASDHIRRVRRRSVDETAIYLDGVEVDVVPLMMPIWCGMPGDFPWAPLRHLEDGRYLVAMAEPESVSQVAALEALFKAEVKTVRVSSKEIAQVLRDAQFAATEPEKMKRLTFKARNRRVRGAVLERVEFWDPVTGEMDVRYADVQGKPVGMSPKYEPVTPFRFSPMRQRFAELIEERLRGDPGIGDRRAMREVESGHSLCPWCGTPILVGEIIEGRKVRSDRKFCDDACWKAHARNKT